jgi:hypothetical protein
VAVSLIRRRSDPIYQADMPHYIELRPVSPLSRLLAGIVAVLVVAAVVFFGLIVLAFVLGAGALLSIGWWIRQRFFAPRKPIPQRPDTEVGSAEVIEAEYTIVSRRRD